jgi:hypothetical protein
MGLGLYETGGDTFCILSGSHESVKCLHFNSSCNVGGGRQKKEIAVY